MKEVHVRVLALLSVVLGGLVLMSWGIHESLHSATLIGALIAILTIGVIYNYYKYNNPSAEQEKTTVVENPIQVVVADLPKDVASQDPINV